MEVVMNRRFWVIGVAVTAAACTTTLEPIGNLGGSGAGEGGAAGMAGHEADASIAGEGGSAAVGGYAGMAGLGGVGGYAGSAGFGGAAGGVHCDDFDPCTIDGFGPDGTCTYDYDPYCGMGGSGGYAGSAGYGGGMPTDAGIAGVGGYGGHAGSAGFGGYGGHAGSAGFGGYGGAAGGLPCEDFDTCTIDVVGPDGTCTYYYDPYCGMGGSGGHGGAGEGGYGGYAGSAGFGGYGGAGEGGYGGVPVDGGIAGSGGYAGSAGYGGSGGCGDMGPDADGDGYQDSICGADCDDTDANAYPYQWSFFVEARNSGGYDYDCDGEVTLRWGQLHSGCSLDSRSQACVGSGWTSEDAPTAFIPGCGQTATYAFCQFTGTGCAVSMHEVTQACR